MDLGDTGLVLSLVSLVVIGGAPVLVSSGGEQLCRVDGRFRTLAADAHELEEFEPGPSPG